MSLDTWRKILEQALDPIEHPVEGRRKLVELVVARPDRHPPPNVAADDRFRRAADRVQSPLEVGAKQHGSAETNDQQHDEGQTEDRDDDPLDALEPVAVDRDDEPLARRQVDGDRARPVRPLARVVEIDGPKPEPRAFDLQ